MVVKILVNDLNLLDIHVLNLYFCVFFELLTEISFLRHELESIASSLLSTATSLAETVPMNIKQIIRTNAINTEVFDLIIIPPQNIKYYDLYFCKNLYINIL